MKETPTRQPDPSPGDTFTDEEILHARETHADDRYRMILADPSRWFDLARREALREVTAEMAAEAEARHAPFWPAVFRRILHRQ